MNPTTTQVQAPVPTTTVQTPVPTAQPPQQQQQVAIPANLDKELQDFLKEVVASKETIAFVKQGMDKQHQENLKRKELEDKKFEEIIKNFLQGEQQIKSLYSSPEESVLVNKAYDNVKNDTTNISPESLNTAILTVKACMAATGNLTKQEALFQQQVSAAVSEQTYPIKKSKLEDMMDYDKPKPFSINPEIIKTIASSSVAPPTQPANSPNDIMKTTKPTLEEAMRMNQRSHFH